jgi:hypothetical protein
MIEIGSSGEAKDNNKEVVFRRAFVSIISICAKKS